ncbi:hypothetical protein LP7551_01416 [Roseibium album]|nr:hypothetical protein LP7551_01416 [Roseibium album]
MGRTSYVAVFPVSWHLITGLPIWLQIGDICTLDAVPDDRLTATKLVNEFIV